MFVLGHCGSSSFWNTWGIIYKFRFQSICCVLKPPDFVLKNALFVVNPPPL